MANAGDVEVNNSGNIATAGTGSPALMAQSIAGGGGYIAETTSQGSYDVTLAGRNLTSADSGKVSVANKAQRLDTLKAYSPALVAQSIGGGGGWSLLQAPNAQLGSESGGWQNADSVEVNNTSVLSTAGNYSAAAVAQTIGGGGGVTGNALGNVTLGASQTKSRLTSGNVNFSQQGQVGTTGLNSAGLVIQSIGGGGGIAGQVLKDATLGQTSAETSISNSGNVTFEGIGETITTEKDGSPTLVIQSIAGGIFGSET